jgi:hypothetical protein
MSFAIPEAANAAVALFNIPENAARLKAPELECELVMLHEHLDAPSWQSVNQVQMTSVNSSCW